MKFNSPKRSVADRTETTNHEGGQAFEPDSVELGLYKVTINNLLEDSFYESDEESLENAMDAFEECASENPEFVLKLAYWAREEAYLRQIPQLLLVLAANDERTKEYVPDYAEGIMQRADEPLEALAMQLDLYGKSIPNPLQKGIEDALHNFDTYQISKWDSDRKQVSYRDLMNLVHPTPRDEERDEIFERIVRGPLDDYPDVEPLTQHRTWENELSEDDDRSQAEKFRERLEADDMGLFAKIRNVRNMLDAGLDAEEILTDDDLEAVPHVKIYPFRYYQAYKAVKNAGYREPHLDRWFEQAIDRSVENVPDEFGETYVSVDLSGSMDSPLSDNSTLTMKEISALFGAVCAKKGARVSAFASDFEEFSFHVDQPILSMQEKILGASIGMSTNGHLPVEHITEESREYENVAVFTDMQLWDSTGGFYGSSTSLKDAWEQYTGSVNPDANLYVVDLASYGDLVTPEGYSNVYNVSGWTSEIVKHIKYSSREDEAIQQVEDYGKP